jgi:hypothetical protein
MPSLLRKLETFFTGTDEEIHADELTRKWRWAVYTEMVAGGIFLADGTEMNPMLGTGLAILGIDGIMRTINARRKLYRPEGPSTRDLETGAPQQGIVGTLREYLQEYTYAE